MPSRQEAGGVASGVIHATAGALEAGLGVVVNKTPVTAPIEEVGKIIATIGSGNVIEFGTSLLHAIPDVVVNIAHAGSPGLAASVLIAEGGRRLIVGAVKVHNARRAG